MSEYKEDLYDKYYLNWLYAVIDTEDDCAFLCDLRDKDEYQREIAEEKNIAMANEYAIADKARLEEIRKTMTEKEFELFQEEELNNWLEEGIQDDLIDNEYLRLCDEHLRRWEEARKKREKAEEWHTKEKGKRGKKEKKAKA